MSKKAIKKAKRKRLTWGFHASSSGVASSKKAVELIEDEKRKKGKQTAGSGAVRTSAGTYIRDPSAGRIHTTEFQKTSSKDVPKAVAKKVANILTMEPINKRELQMMENASKEFSKKSLEQQETHVLNLFNEIKKMDAAEKPLATRSKELQLSSILRIETKDPLITYMKLKEDAAKTIMRNALKETAEKGSTAKMRERAIEALTNMARFEKLKKQK